MKKAYTIIAIFLWLIAHTTSAQNMYRNYQSSPNAVPRPTSAVSVTHSDGRVYLFQANDINQNLSVTTIDPLTMFPTGSNASFTLNVHFKPNGVFEDFNGDFVLFGYEDNNNYWKPAFVRVTHNFLSCDVWFSNFLSGQFTAGCYGYDIFGDKLYMMVTNTGKLYVVNYTNLSLPTPPPLYTYSYSEIPNQNSFDLYTDISWDDTNHHFIATGSTWNGSNSWLHPFVDVFDYDLVNNSIYSQESYIVNNNSYTDVSEGRSLHVQLSSDELLLYQDLRFDKTIIYNNITYFCNYDVIWMSRIKNYLNSSVYIDESMFYVLPNSKISAKDMLYDYYNNRLNFLGVFNQCTAGLTQILAQVNPYNLGFGINVSQLGMSISYGTCQNPQPPFIDIYHNDFDMSNLTLNDYNPCFPVLIAGIGLNNNILTETYDISLSSCDKPMDIENIKPNAKVSSYILNYSTINDFVTRFSCTPQSDYVLMNILCDENIACSHQFGGKSLQQATTNIPSLANIFVKDDKQFVCEGFEGDIQYCFYDITGRLLQSGNTQNGLSNQILLPNGLYLLKAFDVASHQVVKKIVLS